MMTGELTVTTSQGNFAAFCAQPKRSPAPAVIVLHELFGVNDDMRLICKELARRGFFAVCPDLFWRQRPGVDLDVRSEADWQTGLALYQQYDRDLGVSDIAATVHTASALDQCTGKVGLLGYCLGGLMTFLAAARTSVDAAVAFHGADTEKYLREAASIRAPLLMHLAGADEFMPDSARAAIRLALPDKIDAQVFTYEGCRHAFSRHNGVHYDAKAAARANRRTWSFLDAMLDTPRPHQSPSAPASHRIDL